jgi:hypothetical protein
MEEDVKTTLENSTVVMVKRFDILFPGDKDLKKFFFLIPNIEQSRLPQPSDDLPNSPNSCDIVEVDNQNVREFCTKLDFHIVN